MDSVIRQAVLFILLQVALPGKLSATEVQKREEIGSAVHFCLPAVTDCGRYSLISPSRENIITVFNASTTVISSAYAKRSTDQTLDNGTILFTLHHIDNSDEGAYLIEPDGQSKDLCWVKYVLTVIRNSPSTGNWLNWNSWSSCDKTCDAATRVRFRVCPTDFCDQGDSNETMACSENPPCYEWSNWSEWNTCSLTCGSGLHDRHRYCFTHEQQRTDIRHCIGDSYERQACTLTLCIVNQSVTYQWTNWGPWSTCSQTCGTGFRTRDRKCNDGKAIVYSNMCFGLETDNITCSIAICKGIVTGSDGLLGTSDRTVQLPLSAIVGTGAGLSILILTIVICVLVIKLKRKREILGIVKTGSVKKSNEVSSKTYKRKKASVISCSSQGVSNSHVYDEIESDDVRSQRMSVLTIDNTYVAMPKSASPRGPSDSVGGTTTYYNTEETVFVFDNLTPGGQGQNRKESDSYRNTSNNLTVPRHMSVDSTGYLMPGSARRNMKYTKTSK